MDVAQKPGDVRGQDLDGVVASSTPSEVKETKRLGLFSLRGMEVAETPGREYYIEWTPARLSYTKRVSTICDSAVEISTLGKGHREPHTRNDARDTHA
jgi:hypothetical protein